MEELQQLTEDLSERAAKPGSRPGSLKRKAAQYLGKGAGEKLSKTDLKRLRAKANKMKKSTKKSPCKTRTYNFFEKKFIFLVFPPISGHFFTHCNILDISTTYTHVIKFSVTQ